MKALRRFVKRSMASLLGRRDDERVREELAEHLTMLTEQYVRAGMLLDEARRKARLTLGAHNVIIEAVRDEQRLRVVEDAWQDLRHAARTLRKQPAFTLAAVVTLALGIGAYTAIFSLVNSIVLKPLPYPRAEELVSLRHLAPGAAGMGNLASDLRLSASMYFTYAEHTRTFSSVGVWAASTATVTGAGDPEEVRSVLVSDGVLPALGVPALFGRTLGAADQDPGAPVHTVVLGYLEAVARLHPTATIAEASADMARMVPIWMRSWPMAPGLDGSVYETWQITPAIRPLASDVVGNVARVLWVLFGAIGIVLLVACANVAALTLVRMEGRQRELAVRAALGAGRGRVIRALLVESALVAVTGGALGVALAEVGIRLLVAYGPDALPRLHEVAIDARALGVGLATALASSLLVGVLPALRYTRAEIAGTLHAGGRTASDSRERRAARHGLVVVQVALALVLLVASGLMIRSVQALRSVEPGFARPEEIQTVDVAIPSLLVPEPERVARLQHDIADRLSAIAGVTSVGFASVVPMVGGTPDWDVIYIEGREYASQEIPPMRFFKQIAPQYLATMGTRLVAGRDFTWTDLYDRRRVVMVSENMARESWGSVTAAIGQRIRTTPGRPWREVVGVVQDVHEHGADVPAPAIVYWPTFGESPYQAGQPRVVRTVTFTVRSPHAGRETLLTGMRRAVWSANASLSVANERTMTQIYDTSMERVSFTLVLLAVAGLMALALGVIGLYGAIAYAAAQQRREIGIRVALGATPGEVAGMFVRRGVLLAGIGGIVGLIGAVALTRIMSSLLFGVGPFDPPTYIAVSLLLVAAAGAASYIPARKASAVDPVEALQAP